jgi:hypothetical protein
MDHAYKSRRSYQPMHGGYRPKSRWFKGDKSAIEGLERACNLAEAKYRFHKDTHDNEKATVHEAMRNLSIIMRNGRLKP